MKKTVLTLISLLTFQAAHAATIDNFSDRGMYLLGQAGASSVSFGFMDGFLGSMDLKNNSGLAGRIAMGYQFNRYLGLEGGFSAYSGATRVYNSNKGLTFYVNPSPAIGKSDISGIYTADLMASLRIPMGNYFFISALAGASVMHFNYASMNATFPASSGDNWTLDSYTVLQWNAGSAYFVAPKAELRVGGKINPQTALFLSASYIFSVNGNNPEKRNYQPGLGMLSLGVEYAIY